MLCEDRVCITIGNASKDKEQKSMIQDILPKNFHNQYLKKEITENAKIMHFSEGCICCRYEDTMEFLTYREIKQYYNIEEKELPELRYLFSIAGEDYFLLMQEEVLAIEGYTYHRMFETRSMKPKENVFAAATAWHLYGWYRDNVFCGRCGKKLVHGVRQRMLSCPSCKNTVFPKIAPAVIVGVTNGDKILMTKYADREYKRYALIAGFTEIGETAEETVMREVMEEVGLHVKNIHYYKSQPWGYDSNLLLGYFCELDDNAEITMDEEELSAAEWVDYHDVPGDKEQLSLTREMMTYFKTYKLKEHGEA